MSIFKMKARAVPNPLTHTIQNLPALRKTEEIPGEGLIEVDVENPYMGSARLAPFKAVSADPQILTADVNPARTFIPARPSKWTSKNAGTARAQLGQTRTAGLSGRTTIDCVCNVLTANGSYILATESLDVESEVNVVKR
jgi:hypothetical protein